MSDVKASHLSHNYGSEVSTILRRFTPKKFVKINGSLWDMFRFEICGGKWFACLAISGGSLFVDPSAVANPPVPRQTPLRHVDVGPDDFVYAMADWSGVFRKKVDGPWLNVISNKSAANARIYLRGNGELLLTSHEGGPIFLSIDGGRSWKPDGTSQLWPGAAWMEWQVKARVSSISPSGNAYALNGKEVLISQDGGKSWQSHELPAGGKERTLERQAIAGNDELIYLALEGNLFRQKVGSRNWEVVEQKGFSPIASGIDESVATLRFGPEGELVALGPMSTNQRVFISRDGGSSWQEERFGFPNEERLVVELYSPKPDAMYIFVRANELGEGPFKALYRKSGDQAPYIVGIDPNKVNEIVAGAKGKLYMSTKSKEDLFESSDQGRTWMVMSREGIVW